MAVFASNTTPNENHHHAQAAPAYRTDRLERWTSWLPSPSIWNQRRSGNMSQSRGGSISPPPLRRSFTRQDNSQSHSMRQSPSSANHSNVVDDVHRDRVLRPRDGLNVDGAAGAATTGKASNGVAGLSAPCLSASDAVEDSDATNEVDTRQERNSHKTTPGSSQRTTRAQRSAARHTPEAHSQIKPEDWSVSKIVERFKKYRQDIRNDHADLCAYELESTKPVEWRVHHGEDLFANIRSTPVVADKNNKDSTMRFKFKQHIKTKKDLQREEHHTVISVKSNKERVPRYRFHHVEIKKNVLTPNTMLTFVPHLRDLESNEETKYNLWLKELEDIDLKSGFKPMNRDEKYLNSIRSEQAATISLYLDTWLEDLAIPNCNKSTLIRHMARKESDHSMTPQQKTDILKSHLENDEFLPQADKAAEMFTDAFRLVFKENQPSHKQIDLRSVLLLDESVDSIIDSKPTTKDVAAASQNDDEDDVVEAALATYCILGCLMCLSHSCDHGEYDNKNWKRTFSLSSCCHLSDVLRRRRQTGNIQPSWTPCRRRCHRAGHRPLATYQTKPWTEDQRIVTRCLVATTDPTKGTKDPICMAAEFLDRDCCDVYTEYQSLHITLPEPEPQVPSRNRNLSWYDRKKKMLLGDWQDHTITHEHQRREIIEPCFHEGPCAPKICSCVDANILCEKFCGCTVENCAYKFTGCACHSQGKTCQSKNKDKDKPCICVQLNRECDPQLCGSCGALERADPLNAEDEKLHSTGCQNCEMQRGDSKALVLGQSQLEGVGYGLFTAEDIAQDDFVIEYVGELITHDEGVRREARRGDVFDEDSNISYVFTLLENEGIWVDAAIYGNLSRYINHASESDKRGCNITPRILYVNGEFRIKFTAMRDIKAGEELFFNYGENFPNLTKKLLDHKAGEEPDSAIEKRRRTMHANSDRVARKAPKLEPKKVGRPKASRKFASSLEWQSVVTASERGRRPLKRKRQPSVGSDEDEDEDSELTSVDRRPRRQTSERASVSETPTRASKRARIQMQADSTKRDSEAKPKDKPKPKGKRGGARPGSGRPRKHPLPTPKTSQAGDADVSVPVTPSKAAPAPAQEHKQAEESERPELQSASKPLSKQPQSASPTTPQHRRSARVSGSRGAPEVVEIEDSDDGGLQDDDEEDEDVVVRKRKDRSSRNRRPPAKFRDNQTWT